jgi:MFS family permease
MAQRRFSVDPAGYLVAGIVFVVFLLRLCLAFALPLTGDEAYYWEWSRHLAPGYTDHPPGVALTIAAFMWLGRSPFAIRVGFVLCGLLTTLFAAAAARRLSGGDVRAGRVAAVLVTLAPICTVAFGIATPDGPYAAAWAATIYAAIRAFGERQRSWFVLLGVALGAALLSRLFGFVLLLAIVAYARAPANRWVWRAGLWWTFAVACILLAPYLAWNATHGWTAFAFALLQRHAERFDLLRPIELALIVVAAYSPGWWTFCGRLARAERSILWWSVLPFSVLLLVLALREPVEIYWFLGPFISLSIAAGAMSVGWSRKGLRWFTYGAALPAALVTMPLYAAIFAPGAVYAALQRTTHVHLSNNGPFETFTYPPLARDVHAIARSTGAVVVTDGYGLSSLIDFYGDEPPVLIGYDAQGREAKRWYSVTMRPARLFFVDKEPFSTRADFQRQFARACASVVPGPLLSYIYSDPSGANVPPRLYYTTWCDGVKPGGMATLRWEKPMAI